MSVPKEIPEALRKKIVHYYTEDDLTQWEVAKRCGTSVNTVVEVLRSSNAKINYTRRYL